MKHERIVHIVDDDLSVGDSLTVLMESVGLPSLVFHSAREFLDQYDNTSGCLLLDVRMPGMDGMELHQELKKRQIRLPVILLTAYADVPLAVKAMRMGAVDFIEKPFDPEALLSSIRACLDNYASFSLPPISLDEAQQRLSALSKREHEVLALLVEGKLSKVIADELGISPRTVEGHRARIMSKLNARSLPEVIRVALAGQRS